jgi:hypothetical protein
MGVWEFSNKRLESGASTNRGGLSCVQLSGFCAYLITLLWHLRFHNSSVATALKPRTYLRPIAYPLHLMRLR